MKRNLLTLVALVLLMFFLFAGSLFAVESGEPLFVLTGASYRPLGEKESFDVLAVTNRQTWLALGDDADERIVSEVLSCAGQPPWCP